MELDIALPDFEPGSVWLVGAGPGDPGLLTLLALHALAEADVVVHDALVDDRVAALINRDAERIDVGKRGGRPSPKQTEICARLVALAREGRRVLRLKGGDPFTFGRGADEALALAEAGVPWRVVPGVTAGLGGLAYAGIPATHGAANSTVALVTGHDAAGGLPRNIDWHSLARGVQVIVFYMASRNLGEIARRLIEAGRERGEAVALVGRATLPDQDVAVTTLGEAAESPPRVATPAIVAVGPTVALHAALDWFRPPREDHDGA